jgi:hypothetical protein
MLIKRVGSKVRKMSSEYTKVMIPFPYPSRKDVFWDTPSNEQSDLYSSFVQS